ncbi:Beta-lactamase class A [Streptomyces sp. DI166]|uniref:serine hydrolase n=1 Tax=Streptomyces sp. DI166 TaxID=1839783 RepID=UPI0007F35C61|nr:serine hydrolase [Streptomyces sp. DI166]SBT93302.1 Beta-lactamase class A [Streptomyces sp. DI166]
MEPSRASSRARRRRVPSLYLALAAVTVVGGTAAGTVYVQERDAPLASVSSSSSPVVVAASEEASVEPVTLPTVDPEERLAEAMESVRVAEGARVSVAVLDVGSGASAAYGEASFVTASIVKVDVLAALLLRAQDEGRALTSAEKAYATAMIERSDNDSASALWETVGRAEGLAAANERLGLTDTEGGDGMLWGLTRTTAADQLRLLGQVFGAESELSAASRAYLQGLMGKVVEDQRWGVSTVADGSACALKNGWLPRSTTGLWVINSVGRVTVDGREFLVAALSDGNATKEDGVALVEAAAKAAVSVFARE